MTLHKHHKGGRYPKGAKHEAPSIEGKKSKAPPKKVARQKKGVK